ncbi:M13 family metallopeptidase [Hydrotalea sandarakina]|jgi:putative endopeptidase|uniref:Putative endopeptidase n=1 Tax=Hydrotalea sandarakina TaxID=1004304 RepID=A0A2W7RI17_9BACT|nr:M13 family metallopeptidase [Hydrotalea sandarakina]PZX60548.1 putative endopeptidase [Hydrotalea sandarakina]
MKFVQTFVTSTALAMLACTGCQQKQNAPSAFIDLSAIDTSVKPGDNFFLYANGNWLKKTTIPASEVGAGAFLDLYNRTKNNIHTILLDAEKNAAPAGSIQQKVGDFFASGMDSTTIEKLGYTPIQPELNEINTLKNAADIIHYAAQAHTRGSGMLFDFGVYPDDKNSMATIAVFSQGGLGLPDRDYYFKTDAATQAVVQAYKNYLQKLLILTGTDSLTATQQVEQVYALEKQMAESHKTNVALRDPQSNYHKMAVAQLSKTMPNLQWPMLLKTLNIQVDSINVQQPEFYAKLNQLITTQPIATWQLYLRLHTLNGVARYLSTPFVQASFNYYGKALNGQTQMKPRWENVYRTIDAQIGEALGQLYVEKYFTKEAKQRMDELVNNLQKAFANRINNLDWMSDSTKQKAKDKLQAFIKKIGYPDKWRDYSKVNIQRNQYFNNIMAAEANNYQYMISKLGKPVDRTEWEMTPPTINAYYNPLYNEIVFPAGILQFPFFDPQADDAINYGGIGMVIGHEMTHGFDDQGAQYDKDGNLKNWWSTSDYDLFRKKSQQVIQLYNGFTILDTVHVNGALTTGENIADIGGIAIAYDAFKMTKEGQDTTQKIDGYTPDQRFFLSLAQIWRSKEKDAYALRLINTDPHSPAMYRVNGPLMNFTPFYKAFNVVPGEKMYLPENERIKIW